jgi:protein gp37
MRKEWVVSIRDQCLKQRVPFFFKQWGGVRKAKNGRMLDGRTYDEYPERPLTLSTRDGANLRSRYALAD